VVFEIWAVALYNPVVNARLRRIYSALSARSNGCFGERRPAPRGAPPLRPWPFTRASVFFRSSSISIKSTPHAAEEFQAKIAEWL
jgi:hypothetical protein